MRIFGKRLAPLFAACITALFGQAPIPQSRDNPHSKQAQPGALGVKGEAAGGGCGAQLTCSLSNKLQLPSPPPSKSPARAHFSRRSWTTGTTLKRSRSPPATPTPSSITRLRSTSSPALPSAGAPYKTRIVIRKLQGQRKSSTTRFSPNPCTPRGNPWVFHFKSRSTRRPRASLGWSMLTTTPAGPAAANPRATSDLAKALTAPPTISWRKGWEPSSNRTNRRQPSTSALALPEDDPRRFFRVRRVVAQTLSPRTHTRAQRPLADMKPIFHDGFMPTSANGQIPAIDVLTILVLISGVAGVSKGNGTTQQDNERLPRVRVCWRHGPYRLPRSWHGLHTTDPCKARISRYPLGSGDGGKCRTSSLPGGQGRSLCRVADRSPSTWTLIRTRSFRKLDSATKAQCSPWTNSET